jgi:hypothetical protein
MAVIRRLAKLGAFARISVLAMVHFLMSLPPLLAAMLAWPLAPAE